MQKVSEKAVSNNSNVKAAILEQNGDGPIFQNDVAAVYPYLSSDNSVVSLIAFKEGSDTMRLLGRWQLDVNDDKYVIRFFVGCIGYANTAGKIYKADMYACFLFKLNGKLE